MTGRAWFAALVVVAIAAPACGDDGGGESTAACDAFVAIDEAAIADDIDGMIAAFEDFVATAPDDVADVVEPVIPLMRDDPEAAAESEELATAEAATDEWALDCADRRIELEALNFAFPALPEEVKAGRMAFTMRNATQTDEAHEALVLRKDDDVDGSAHDVLAAALQDRPVSVDTTLAALDGFAFVGAGLVEPPGGDEEDVFVVDLDAGEYVVACLLPVDSAEQVDAYFAGEEVEGEYHFQRGMFAELTVV